MNISIPYVPPILGQLLDLISPTKINISEPRLESYDPWDMANWLLWYNTSILKVRIFYFKIPKKYSVFFCLLHSGTWVHKRVRVKFKVPEYGLKFPSTSQGSRVRILEKIGENHQLFKSLKNNYNLFYRLMQVNLPCPMGHMIPIWAQKYWFWQEILGREVGPISVGHTVHCIT